MIKRTLVQVGQAAEFVVQPNVLRRKLFICNYKNDGDLYIGEWQNTLDPVGDDQPGPLGRRIGSGRFLKVDPHAGYMLQGENPSMRVVIEEVF